jgi:hypothetical protein
MDKLGSALPLVMVLRCLGSKVRRARQQHSNKISAVVSSMAMVIRPILDMVWCQKAIKVTMLLVNHRWKVTVEVQEGPDMEAKMVIMDIIALHRAIFTTAWVVVK